MNLNQWFRCYLEILSGALVAPFFGGADLFNFGRRHHEEQFCEIILKLDL